MPNVAQEDLFTSPAIVARNIPSDAPATKRRRVTDSQRAAHQAFQRDKRGPSADARCLAEIERGELLGRTRQEIADRTEMKLQTVCGCVNRLVKQGKIVEPVIGYESGGRPIHDKREGRNVCVSQRYASAREAQRSA